MIRINLVLILMLFCRLLSAQIISDSTAFDFWIGKWDVQWYNPDSSIGSGTNHIYKILEGNVLQENFLVEDDPNLAGYEGKSWSVFNKRDYTWRQTWVDNQTGYIEFKGVLEDNRKIFRTEIKVQGEKDLVSQMVFYNISPNSFTWDWMRSENGGEDWELLWRIYYKRQEYH